MKRELRDAVCAAARSGEYKQCTGQTVKYQGTKEEAVCILGLICKVAGIDMSSDDGSPLVDGKKVGYEPIYAMINPALDEGDEFFGELGDKLFILNDQDKKSLAELADWIEANIPVED